ncbi:MULTISPECIES: acyl-CoA carboxylase epsilon subunit [unclassified Micromonospora]|uniref:acyl-CoA carboxylase epsilon subunit n=1 Tax=unclassified Micromonospora TaxID=2617518 RepID=UPI002FEF6CFC
MTAPEGFDAAGPVPRLVVVRGAPTEEELAAATVALMCSLRAARDGSATVSRRAEASWSAVDYRAPGAWASRCH